MNAAAPWLLPTNGRITVTVKLGIGDYTRFRTLPGSTSAIRKSDLLASISLLLVRKSDLLVSVSLLLVRKSDLLVSISLLLVRKSDLLVSISLLLVSKSDFLVSISLLLVSKSDFLVADEPASFSDDLFTLPRTPHG